MEHQTIFISGSISITELPPDLEKRLTNVIKSGFKIIIGDANGADKAFQRFLADQHYQEVVVYCSRNRCRNNLGQWRCQNVQVPSHLTGRAFYTEKDKEMARLADYGLVLWDGKSKGSLANIKALLKRNKKSLVYLNPNRTFYIIANAQQIGPLQAAG